MQGGVTLSESKLVICDEAVREKKGFHINCNDGSFGLADDWKLADRSVVKEIRFCTFLCNAVMLADFQEDG